MARRDDILRNFMKHEIITNNDRIKEEDIPSTVIEATKSKIPIICTIGLIVEKLESSKTITDKALLTSINQYLTGNAI